MAELKFLKGGRANWATLSKDADSFYIVLEEDGRYSLYLGETLIADGLSKAMLAAEAERALGAEAGLAARIKTIEDALYATQGDVQDAVDTLNAAIEAETEAREAAISGLTQTVADNKAAIEQTVSALTQTVESNKTAIEQTVSALTQTVEALEDADDAINATIGEVADGKTVVEMIADAQAAAEAAATILVEETDGHVTVSGVQSEETGAWTYTIAGNDIASAAVLAEVKEDVDNFFKDASFAKSAKDTLKELQEYITSDTAGALAMEQAIADNKKAIENEVARAEAAEKKLGEDLAAEAERADAAEKANAAAVVAEKERAEAAEEALGERVTALEKVEITADENSNIKVTKGENGNIKISFEWLTF